MPAERRPSPATPGVWHEIAGDPASPLAVVVHGSMDRSAGVLRLSRRLDERFRVLRYDRRGYARSVDVGGPFTVEANIDDLERLVVDHRGNAESVVLFGHSFGGNVVLGLAARRPDLADAIVVYETPLSWLDWWPGDSAGGAAMAATDPGDAAEAFMRRLMGDETWERLSPSKREDRRQEGAAMVGELADLRRSAPWDPARLEVPVLVLAGARARPHHRSALEHLGGALRGCRTQVIEGAGHAGPHSHPDAVAAAIFDFIDSPP